MTLLEYKNKTELNYYQIAEQTGIPRTLLHRICTKPEYCIKLYHASVLVKWSRGEITYESLLGDC